MTRRTVAPLAGALLGVALLVASRGLDTVSAPGQLGPAFWPRLVLGGLVIACLAKAVEEGRRSARDPLGVLALPIARRRLAVAIGVIVLHVLLTPLLGFPLATAAFIVTFMALGGIRSPLALGAFGLLGTVALLYLFVKIVYLPLPKGAGSLEDVSLALYRALGIF